DQILFSPTVDDHQNQFVQRLKEWVAVQSNSGDHTKWGEVERILNMTAVRIQEMGGTVEFADVGTHQLPSGETVPLPPVILAEFERDPKKATLCIYGHVDVQPAKMMDGWTTDPFNLTEIKGNLYGRGATDNKGPVLAWLHAVESYQATEKGRRIKLIIEGLEEVGSYGLLELTIKGNDSFFADVDFIVISDNVWATRTPSLTYGTRGSSYFFVEVDGPKLDFHSDILVKTCFIPKCFHYFLFLPNRKSVGSQSGVTDDVEPLTEDERKLNHNISFDLVEMKSMAGVKHFLQDTEEEVLMARWRNPYLSIHGIQGAFSEPGTKTVPNMDPPDVERKVKEHLQHVFSTLKSPNRLRVTATVGAKPWVANLKDPQYVAGQRAVREVFGVDPELIREGSTIPIAQNFQEETGKSVMMLPIVGHDDGEHSQNEKTSRYNYIEGMKLFAAYFYEISLLQWIYFHPTCDNDNYAVGDSIVPVECLGCHQ
uniref:Beta-Ala-His dipeptidase-like n=1 Tax=Salmo trutta TaxID=8032 RepID=A0A674A429_SALTR